MHWSKHCKCYVVFWVCTHHYVCSQQSSHKQSSFAYIRSLQIRTLFNAFDCNILTPAKLNWSFEHLTINIKMWFTFSSNAQSNRFTSFPSQYLDHQIKSIWYICLLDRPLFFVCHNNWLDESKCVRLINGGDAVSIMRYCWHMFGAIQLFFCYFG